MAQVKTNNVSLSYIREASLGTIPSPTTTWRVIEPNQINAFGADISTVSRNPLSKERQRSKGTIVDLDSGVDLSMDLTMDHFWDFAEAFMFAKATDILAWGPIETDPSDDSARDVTAVTATGYTVDQDGDVPDNTLVYARGFTNSANNGLKVTAGTSTTTEVKAAGLVAEGSPPANAQLSVAGVQGATGDLGIDASGNLTSSVLDFTTLGLTAGQVIHIGGQAASNRFANAANFGYARIVSIAANLITLDKKATTFVTDNGAGQDVQILFGRFLRNVPVDDSEYIERTFHFEALYPDLEAVGTDAYEYAIGNYANTLQFNLPLTEKATYDVTFVGTDTEVPTTTRKDRDTEVLPLQIEAFNTSADIARLRVTDVDETGLSTFFKSLNFSITNNVSPEKVLGTLGAAFINVGNFDIDIEAQLLFTNKDVITRIRQNTTVTMDFAIRNNEGALFVDIPSMTLGGGSKEFPENETVLINVPAQAFRDTTLGTSIGISHFPFVPTA